MDDPQTTQDVSTSELRKELLKKMVRDIESISGWEIVAFMVFISGVALFLDAIGYYR